MIFHWGSQSYESPPQELYATYIVQAIAANFHIPSENSSQDSHVLKRIYEAVWLQPDLQRSQQDLDMKWVLQAILRSMSICATVVFVFSDRGTRLPYSPYSIAKTMILLAGSEIASKRILSESSKWNAETDIWEGWLFSLILWGDMRHRRCSIHVERAYKQYES